MFHGDLLWAAFMYCICTCLRGRSSFNIQTKFPLDEHGNFNFFYFLFYFRFSLRVVLFGWELQTFKQKALLSGIQMGSLLVIQTGQEDSQTTRVEMKIALKCGMTVGGGMINLVVILHLPPSVNKQFVALED